MTQHQTTSDLAVLAGRYEIAADAPAPQFDTPTARAYRAIDRVRPGDPHVALICAPEWPPRQDLIDSLVSMRVDELMTPRAYGVVDWQPIARRCTALVFAEPGGGRIVGPSAETIDPMAEDEIVGAVLPSVLTALKALFGLRITHRAIRPDNLYRTTGDKRIVLGEFVSAPPALAQPLVYETIESGMAQPAGRGAGSVADDLYALGVTIVALLSGRVPCHGLTDEQILARKMARGSLATLLDDWRPPVRLLEPLRGLLADDPRERWNLDDLRGWIESRRLTNKQVLAAKKAARPLELGGAAHITARSVAAAMIRDPAEAARSIRTGEFDAWLTRSLADPERTAAVALALGETANVDPATPENRLAARVAMALDPRAPLRYAGFSMMVDGIGPALLEACRAGTGAATIAEALMARLPHFLLGVQTRGRSEASPEARHLDRMRQLLGDRRPGFGIERLLYELNPGLHCLSPAVERHHVVAPSDLLPALEAASTDGRIGDAPIDRHIAAFIAARCRSAIHDWHDALASADPTERSIGTLRVLAKLQGHYGPAALPSLGERMRPCLPLLVERFRSRSRRQRLKAMIGKLGGQGQFGAMVKLVANPDELRRDEAEFQAARAESAALKQAAAALRRRSELRAREVVRLGGRLSIAASVFAAWTAAVVSLVVAG